MIGFDLDKLRLGAHCVRRLSAVGSISTQICVLVLVLWSTRTDGPGVRSLTFRPRWNLRLGIAIAALAKSEHCWIEDFVVRTGGEENGLR